MKVLLVVLMSLTTIVPNGIVKAESESETIFTDKSVYEIGDPIYVTASSEKKGKFNKTQDMEKNGEKWGKWRKMDPFSTVF